MKRSLVALVSLAAMLALAAPPAQADPDIESAKLPNILVDGFSTQPDSFYLLVDGKRVLTCRATEEKSTDTVRSECDVDELAAGEYTAVVVSVKTNGLESPSAPTRLKVSKKYGCRTYKAERVCNVSYTLVPL